jgi:hypothetical protein
MNLQVRKGYTNFRLFINKDSLLGCQEVQIRPLFASDDSKSRGALTCMSAKPPVVLKKSPVAGVLKGLHVPLYILQLPGTNTFDPFVFPSVFGKRNKNLRATLRVSENCKVWRNTAMRRRSDQKHSRLSSPIIRRYAGGRKTEKVGGHWEASKGASLYVACGSVSNSSNAGFRNLPSKLRRDNNVPGFRTNRTAHLVNVKRPPHRPL